MNWGMRTQILAVFIAAVILVTVVSTVIGIQNTTNEQRENIERQQSSTGGGLADSLTILLESLNRTLASTASLIPANDLTPRLDATSVNPILDAVVSQSKSVDATMILDHDGKQIVTRPPTHPITTQDVADHPAFQQARSTGEPAHSFAMVTGSPEWVHPIESTLESDHPHYLVATLNLNRVRELLLNHGLLDTEVYLIGPDGPVVGTAPFSTDDGENDVQGGSLSAAGAVASMEPEDRMVTTLKVDGSDARIVISSSLAPLRASQFMVVVQSLVVAATLSAVTIGIGAWASRRLTRPISQLEVTAHKMATGNLEARAPVEGPPELQRLALTLNRMAADLGREREDLLELQGELESMVQERTAKLEDKRETMEQFFYGASHDIKSPVVAIKALSEMALEELSENKPDRDDLKELLGRIHESGDQLRHFVEDLLQFAHADSLTPEIQEVNISEITRSAARELEPAAHDKEITLVCTGESIQVQTDPDELRHILVNLIQNAIKYMPEDRDGPLVFITWGVRGNRLEVIVQDNGAGIPDAVREHLFQPFTQNARSDKGPDGAGLGLSIVKRIADALDITIRLESPPTGGARFRLTFPRVALVAPLTHGDDPTRSRARPQNINGHRAAGPTIRPRTRSQGGKS